MSTPSPTTPINDISDLSLIQTSIQELQRKINILQSSPNQNKNTLLPDLTVFKNDIRNVIETIDKVTNNDKTPINTYIRSLIKDMINNTDNIFYEEKDDGSTIGSNRLKGELDVLTGFAGFNDLKNIILDILTQERVVPDKQNKIKQAITNANSLIIF